MKIVSVAIGRTINMENFQSERQEITFEVEPDVELRPEDMHEVYRIEIDRAFAEIYPKWGHVHTSYASYMAKKVERVEQLRSEAKKLAEGNNPPQQ